MKALVILPLLFGAVPSTAWSTEYREDAKAYSGHGRFNQQEQISLPPQQASHHNMDHTVRRPLPDLPGPLQQTRPSHSSPDLTEPTTVNGRSRRPYLERSLPLIERNRPLSQEMNHPAPQGEDQTAFWMQLSRDLRAAASRPLSLDLHRRESIEARRRIVRYRKKKTTRVFRTTINNIQTGQSTVITTTMTTETHFNPTTGVHLPESFSQITSVIESDL